MTLILLSPLKIPLLSTPETCYCTISLKLQQHPLLAPLPHITPAEYHLGKRVADQNIIYTLPILSKHKMEMKLKSKQPKTKVMNGITAYNAINFVSEPISGGNGPVRLLLYNCLFHASSIPSELEFSTKTLTFNEKPVKSALINSMFVNRAASIHSNEGREGARMGERWEALQRV